MHLKKTAALTAVAALALPGAAIAGKPDHAGSKGKGKTTAQDAKSKTKGVGFSLKGDGLTTLPLTTTGATTSVGTFSIDPDKASGQARRAFGLSKADLRGTEQVALTDAVAGVGVKYAGFPEGGDKTLQATDVVKVIGRVQRTRKARTAASRSDRFSFGSVDIRKIIVTRGETETESETSGS